MTDIGALAADINRAVRALAAITQTPEHRTPEGVTVTGLDDAIAANGICVDWAGSYWVWCCNRHEEGSSWLSDNPADDPAGRREVAAHLAEHVEFDQQPREIARRALIELHSAPRFWTGPDFAIAALDIVWPIAEAAIKAAQVDAQATTDPGGTPGREIPDSVTRAVLGALGWMRTSELAKSTAADAARAAIDAWQAHRDAIPEPPDFTRPITAPDSRDWSRALYPIANDGSAAGW